MGVELGVYLFFAQEYTQEKAVDISSNPRKGGAHKPLDEAELSFFGSFSSVNPPTTILMREKKRTKLNSFD